MTVGGLGLDTEGNPLSHGPRCKAAERVSWVLSLVIHGVTSSALR